MHYANLLVQALLEKWPESRALKTSLELAAMNMTGGGGTGATSTVHVPGVSSHHHSTSSAHSTSSTSNSQDIPYSHSAAQVQIALMIIPTQSEAALRIHLCALWANKIHWSMKLSSANPSMLVPQIWSWPKKLKANWSLCSIFESFCRSK